MERMFSPWRHAYMTEGAKAGGCVLCEALDREQEKDSLVVHRGARSFVVMNLYPYNGGHAMIAPHRHVGSLSDASLEEVTEIMTLARRLEGALTDAYRPDGINLGMNLGRPAGAGVADHIHLHMVPRWIGDTNFMTVLGETRVLSEDPLQACARLRPYFRA